MVVRDQRPQPKMEKPKGRRRNMKTHYLCMPRLRSSNPCTKNNGRLSPMSLLERLREAVFRLIMLSALSKATHQTGSGDAHGSYYRPTYEPHHSEAVADCIEFIKKSATTEENRDSTASSSIDATTELVIPVPVM